LFSANPSAGCKPLDVTFYNMSTNTGQYCLWDFGDGSAVVNACDSVIHTYTVPGSYDVMLTVYSPQNCRNDSLATGFINVYENPVAEFESSPNPTTIFNTTVYFTDLSSGTISSYIWNFAGLDSSQVPNPVYHFPADTGTYPVKLVVSSPDGCSDTVIHWVKIENEYMIFIPSAFTPTGNGPKENETFRPVGFGISPENYHLYVFDRWGNLLFETQNLYEGWDGTYKNEKVMQGVYNYKIVLKDLAGDQHTYIGKVLVIR
jgi:gliding motility-associated-like protein